MKVDAPVLDTNKVYHFERWLPTRYEHLALEPPERSEPRSFWVVYIVPCPIGPSVETGTDGDDQANRRLLQGQSKFCGTVQNEQLVS